MEELFDLVDDRDRVIGRAGRGECHGNPALIHRTVHVLIFNTQGDLYLQKRSPDKDVQPDRWDTSVGGHLGLGENYDEAAGREMAEELGITGVSIEHLYDYRWRTDFESENIRTYQAVCDGRINPDPVEIAEGRFWTLSEIQGAIGTGVFTPNFEMEIDRYLRRTRRSGGS